MTSWSTGVIYVPRTEWMAAPGIDVISMAVLVTAMVAVGGTTSVQLAYQTAAVRVDAPDAWNVVPSSPTATGATGAASNSLSVSGITSGKMWIRWGIAYSASVTPSAADVMLTLATVDLGMPVGSWRGQLAPVSSTISVVAVSGLVPTAWAQGVCAGIIVSSAGGATSFFHKLMFRLAATAQSVPGAWQVTTDSGPGSGGNIERAVQDNTLTTTSNMWIQFGLGYWSTAAAGTPSIADVAVSVIGRSL